jgi:hypothetical protein
MEEPAQGAAPGPVFAETAENAQGGVGAKSYAQGGRSDTGAGQNAGRTAGPTAARNAGGNGALRLRVNLLRFPPVPRTKKPTETPAIAATTPATTATPPVVNITPAVLALPKPGGNGKKPHARLVLRRAATSFPLRTSQPPRGA